MRKIVTIVFSDVVGSSGLGERLDPEQLRHVMTRYYEVASAALARHGGRVEKFIGDAVVAVFGVPLVREDDALRAVRAAAELHAGLGELNSELQRDFGVTLNLRTGVNTGEVVVGGAVVGQDIALGDVVNVSARLEQMAAPGETLLGDATYRLVRDAVTVELLAPLMLKGKGIAVVAWRLLAVKPGAAGHTRRLDTPIVGRDRELALLVQAFERTMAEGTSHVVTLLGASGVGKSRMLHELLTRIRGSATVLRGHCLAYGEGMTYWPLAEVVHQAAGASVTDDPADVRRKVKALIPAPDQASVAAKLGVLLGDTNPDIDVTDLTDALHRLLSVLAKRRPVILVLDDLHWAEGALLDLLERLGDWLRDTPVLLCCLARPELLELRPGWGGGRINATTLLLQPLTSAQSAALVHNLLGRAEGAAEARERVITAAEGNPLYLEELVGMLIDDGLLTRVDDHWAASADLSRVDVPPTIAALLAARLDGLPARERVALERASVVGNVFDRAAVVALSPNDDAREVTEDLLNLIRKELIRPGPSTLLGESALRFRHLLMRDAAYNSLSKRERADLHERCATWLIRALVGRITEVEEIVGYHLEQASRYRTGLGPPDARTLELAQQAAEHLIAAGRRAFGRRDMPAAVNLLTRGVSLSPPESRLRLDVLPDLAACHVEMGEFDRAESLLAEAVAGAERLGDGQLLGSAARVQSVLQLLIKRGEVAPPAEYAPAAAKPAAAAGWTLLTDVSWLRGGGGGGGRESIEPASGGNTAVSTEESPALDAFAMSALLGPIPVRTAIEQYTQVLNGENTNPTGSVRVLAALAGLTAMEGRFEEARAHLAQARSILEQLGLRVRAVALVYLAGLIELLAERPAQAEEQLRRGCEDCERMGEKHVLGNLLALRAQAAYAQQRFTEAVQLAEAGEAAAGPNEVGHITALGARAKALARLDPSGSADVLARQAVAAAAKELLVVRADALLDLAEVYEIGGRRGDASRAAQEALDLYHRKGHVVSARRTEIVLARLRA
jgi:predicted ATPase/class 3 adenylate cyclase